MRILALLLCGCLALVVRAGNPSPPSPAAVERTPPAADNGTPVRKPALAAVDSADDLILLEKSSRSLPPVQASPDESTIARITARILAQNHYLHQRLDDAVSSRFLDRYLDAVDNLRLHFLQSDVQEFERYRARLDDLIKRGDTSPGREIFARFLERVEQRVAYVGELLKTEKFEFTGNDRYNFDRRHSPRPKDLEEAKQVWRQHLRYEVLQEKLSAKKAKRLAGQERPKNASPDEPTRETEPSISESSGLPPEIIKTISRRYARILRTLREFDGADVFQIYLTALTHVYDPHSDYLGKASLDNFAINMNLSLFGIGAVLTSEDGYCKVRELRPGPAMRSKKIKPGDRIVAVAQEEGELVDVVDTKLSKVVELIRGPKGTKVRLLMIPVDAPDPSQRTEVTLIRDEIRLEDEEAKAKIVDVPGRDGQSTRIGIIDLPSFYASIDLGFRNGRSRPKSTTLDVARLLGKLKEEKVAGVILDLRRNGGGSLEEAIELTGLFIKEGPVVQVRDSSDRVIEDKDTDPLIVYDGPLIVLTSRFSASASEILAGALQDYGRALIVGDISTHGKGTVQSLIQLQPWVQDASPDSTNNPGALKITVRKFYRASGSSTQLKGVTPDIVLPSVNNYAEVGESSLDDPLPWDTIPSAQFERLNRIEPILPELRRQSEQRVAADKDFAYVREDIEQYKKYLADKSMSLNEEVRRKEKQENEERLEARKKERKARNEPPEKAYEITLKQVALPGLPPPVSSTNEVAGAEDPAAKAKAEEVEADAEEDKAPPVDVTLKETKRILGDLISLSSKETGLAGRR